MATYSASLDSLVHPHQMEVQEFDSYALVIDARRAEAYREDHLPGAVNLPVTAVAPPAVREPSASEAPTLGVAAPALSLTYALAAHTRRLSPGDTVLVYCDRGGLDSLVWAQALRDAGWRVDVLGGGWGNYRRWLNAGLELLPRVLTLRPLVAPPASGMCRVVEMLTSRGEQVLDLSALAGQWLVPGLTLTGDEPPSQAAFETALLDALRRVDPRRPVWVRDSIAGLGDLCLPPAFRDALRRSGGLTLEVPVDMRARSWSVRLQALDISFEAVLSALSTASTPPSPRVIERCCGLAEAGEFTDALTTIIESYIDKHWGAASSSAATEILRLDSLDADAVSAAFSARLAPPRTADPNTAS